MGQRSTLFALLALCGALQLAAAAATLRAVDDSSFEATVASAPEVFVLEFGSPRCGTCQEFAPLFEQLADRHSGTAQFGVVDIDEPAGMALAQRLGVLDEGVPNVRAFVTAGGEASGARVFSGWELPSAEELDARLRAALAPAGDVTQGTPLMKVTA